MHSQEAYFAVCVGKEHSVNNKTLTYTEYFQLIKCQEGCEQGNVRENSGSGQQWDVTKVEP